MTDWSAGYVTDIAYTYGYYGELNPLKSRICLLNAGFQIPEFRNACELGFGQGVSVNVHAAASSLAWSGTDFNPSQAGFAFDLASQGGSQVVLSDAGFEEFCARDDLPSFDFIALHGIWSWISDDNRDVIRDFIRRKLSVGGLVYMSYNTLPGWAHFAPMRHLIAQHASRLSGPGEGMVSRIDSALAFAEGLLGHNPAYLQVNPAVGQRFEQLKGNDRHYLAHEYFNRDWRPMYFSEVSDMLSEAKLSYACSAHYLDHVQAINLSPGQADFLAAIPDRQLAETARDFMVNQQFRRDYWIKGPRVLSAIDRRAMLREERVALISARENIKLSASGARGEVTLREEVYSPILDMLSDHQPRSLGELERGLQSQGVALDQIIEAALILAGQGNLTSVQGDEAAEACRENTRNLNRALINRAHHSGDIAVLASPLTGGGLPVARFSQLFVEVVQSGIASVDDLALHVWRILKGQGQVIVKNGQPLEGEAANVAELKGMAEEFLAKQLPILRAMEVVS